MTVSDSEAHRALCSGEKVVVLEAPAGCGKTYQGASCVEHFATRVGDGRVLVLTHTHAASDVFSERAAGAGSRVDVRTIDSLIGEVAKRYHLALGLPEDPSVWARSTKDGYAGLARKVEALVAANEMIGRALSLRYPVVVCDEHQDASAAQESVIRSMMKAGSMVRILGDPMQGIFPAKSRESADKRWKVLLAEADRAVELDTPHRWSGGAEALGDWILAARAALRSGGKLDLLDPPEGLHVIRADNQSPRYGGFQLERSEAKPIWSMLNDAQSLWMLSAHNKTVQSVRAFFGRRLPLWEGHTRDQLDKLVEQMKTGEGSPVDLCQALVAFMGAIASGFSRSKFGNRLISEVETDCSKSTRGRPAAIQAVGRELIKQPDQVGVAAALRRIKQDPVFGEVHIDYPAEFRDAIHMGDFADLDEGLAELARRRTFARAAIPRRAVSNVHKAKGLECENVIVLPCDGQHFPDNEKGRCLLYVAISRASRSLALVVPRDNPSALLRVD